MKELKVVAQDNGYFLLQGDLNRVTVPLIKQPLIALKSYNQGNTAQPATLDMSGIAHSDTAGLAWLLNLLKQCKQDNTPVQLQNIPETLVNLAKISDVDSFFSLQ